MDAIFGAGKMAKKISKREYNTLTERSLTVVMSDGVNIDIDIFRPDSRGKFPALVAMSPYNKDVQSDRIWPDAVRAKRVRGIGNGGIEAGPIDFFVRRGYVYIIGSVRGTGKSGGAYKFFDNREIKDICEVIEWAAGQPWCNGNVGTYGISYFGAVQTQVAAMQPPHLKAIAPFTGFWDTYRYFWWPGGILHSGFLKWWCSIQYNLDIHTQGSVLREELGEEGFKKAIARAMEDKDFCADPELVEVLKNPDVIPNANILDIMLHPADSPYWTERRTDCAKIKVPSYLGAAGHRPGEFYHFSELDVPKKLVNAPPAYTDRPYYQFAWELLRWYDHWLKGLDTGIMDEPAVNIFVQGSNEWKRGDDYPFPETKWIPFALHENHSLCEIEPWPGAESASYDDAPGNRGFLKYSSAPMVENTEIAGPIVLNLYASCRGTDMNFFVGLWDADPEGKEIILSRGYLKASHRELDEKLSKPWLPVHTHIKPRPLVPGQVYQFSINIYPTANLFKAGHRVVLKISSADDEPENVQEVRMYHLSSPVANTITVYHSAEYPSHLLLPITKGNIVGTYVSGGDISLKNKEFMKLE